MKKVNSRLAQPFLQNVWLRRIGTGGFFFFLAKGLLWLSVPALLTMLGLG